ncbi:HlyD family secretion protein [Mucilaginibacter ginsenosidivorans]|uniref:HlyD family efflux transporter periplasmic adaptor subunit n=1 Tax=Mucilaginibacter ginsenosidivorans TaxID=398053 RepID=A0A5B8US29_9SPHI|nr:HlyD family efflux transporter periplasmic adaptor subunit [Mucilaginibacter ginsenosidivorans]QEC61668.1 HlyD family efflux transporter periplasmic adaptor subunit [Mucilaginibacter ginsenosidivorans]
MPVSVIENGQEVRHTDDMQDIITTVPSWILRWGITLFFALLVLLVGLSAFIRYPDIVNASLTIYSPNSPKPIVAKIQGKLVKLLVKENEYVAAGQPLAYIESTADHGKILNLLTNLNSLQKHVLENKPISNILFNQADNSQFGELQSAYQVFFQEYLLYKSSINDGLDVKKKAYLQKNLVDIDKQEQQLNAQKSMQQKDFGLAIDEYAMHKKLASEKVETPAELRQQESKYLAKKAPLIQTESALISLNNDYLAKQKEILELDNEIEQEKFKFIQALNSLISQVEDWKSKYVLTASQPGKLAFANIVQENEVINANQQIFYINPENEQFFGQMAIPQNSMGKVKEGQQVLIKLHSYPFEEYGMLRGRISNISDIPYKDSVFLSRVDFKINKTSDMKRSIHLKQGMLADAEIVTQDATILQRISRNIIKVINNK